MNVWKFEYKTTEGGYGLIEVETHDGRKAWAEFVRRLTSRDVPVTVTCTSTPIDREISDLKARISDRVMALECADGSAYYEAKKGREGRHIRALESRLAELRRLQPTQKDQGK